MSSSPTPPSSSSTSPLIPISLTASSLGSHLLPTEEVLSLCSSVGLYAGSSKLPHQQDGVAYLTSHRIIYIDSKDTRGRSGYLPLGNVKMTEYYAGFLKSSPKVILGLKEEEDGDGAEGSRAQLARIQDELANASISAGTTGLNGSATRPSSTSPAPPERWICTVCSFSNTSGGGSGSGGVDACQLCGVKRDPRAPTIAAPPAPSPAARPRSLPAAAPPAASQHTAPGVGVEIACPTCTFLNHPSMPRCEICDSPLGVSPMEDLAASGPAARPTSASPSAPNTPHTRPATPAAAPAAPVETTVKLSFRKGGDKAFYEALSQAMRRGAWRASSSTSVTNANTSKSATSRPSSSPFPPRSPTQPRIDIDGRSTPSSSSSTGPVVGIDGLLTAYNTRSATQRSDMSDALRDLEAFMGKAKQMVDLAESLNAKLTRREAEMRAKRKAAGEEEGVEDEHEQEDEEAATLIRSSLVQLGLPTRAVTKEMARGEEEYHEGLARELAHVLLVGQGSGSSASGGGLMGKGKVLAKGSSWPTPAGAEDGDESDTLDDFAATAGSGSASSLLLAPTTTTSSTPTARGILSLDEIWVLWNRLRGFGALVPPATLLAVLPILPRITRPSIDVRVFAPAADATAAGGAGGKGKGEGLKVLHTPRFGGKRFARRTVRRLLAKEGEERRERRSHAQNGDRAPLPLEGLTTLRFAQLEGLSLRLTYDLLVAVEMDTGAVVRDDGGSSGSAGGDGTQWFRNRFEELAKEVQ